MRDYTIILAWQKSDDLTVAIYEATKQFPKEEQWALTSQLRRAAYSVPANITEGASRDSKKDYLHFLYIARGSLNEAQYFVHLSKRLGYIEQQAHDRLMAQANEVGSTLNGLIRAVSKEVNIVSRAAAKLTSLIVLSMPLVSGLQSPVSKTMSTNEIAIRVTDLSKLYHLGEHAARAPVGFAETIDRRL